MGDADQRGRTLTQRLAPEVDRTVLGHHPVDVSTRRHHAGPRLERWHDARDASVGRGRRQRDNRDAIGRQRGAADEIHLPADPRIDPEPDRVGDHLAGEVDLERRVDCDD